MEKLFLDIYARNEWGTGSGPGSLPQTTGEYRDVVQRLLRDLRPCRVLDAGCGYFEPYAAIDWAGVDYLGVDVVPAVIEANSTRFAREGRRFERRDLTDPAARPAPAGFDLVLVKDVLQHWSAARVMPFLRYLSRFPRVLITNSTNRVAVNRDGPDGDFRALDVRLPPYCVPAREIGAYEVKSNPPLDWKTMLYWEPGADRWTAPGVYVEE